MDSLTTATTFDPAISARRSPGGHHRYVALFRDLMKTERLSFRAISEKAGLSKSRIGLLLHANADQRVEMYMHEFHRLLGAFELDEMEALVLVNTYQDMVLARHARFRRLLALLSLLFTELPPKLLRRIEMITGFDGSEVHPYWKDHIMNLVIDKLSDGVSEIIARRECPFEMDRDLAKRLGITT